MVRNKTNVGFFLLPLLQPNREGNYMLDILRFHYNVTSFIQIKNRTVSEKWQNQTNIFLKFEIQEKNIS